MLTVNDIENYTRDTPGVAYDHKTKEPVMFGSARNKRLVKVEVHKDVIKMFVDMDVRVEENK